MFFIFLQSNRIDIAKKNTKKDSQEPVTNCDQSMEVVANWDWFKTLKYSPSEPYAFTVYGVSMLPSVLTRKIAVDISIRIIDAFVAMRRFIIQNANILMRIANLEKHQIETDEKIDAILDKMEENSPKLLPEAVFPTGCVWKCFFFNLKPSDRKWRLPSLK